MSTFSEDEKNFGRAVTSLRAKGIIVNILSIDSQANALFDPCTNTMKVRYGDIWDIYEESIHMAQTKILLTFGFNLEEISKNPIINCIAELGAANRIKTIAAKKIERSLQDIVAERPVNTEEIKQLESIFTDYYGRFMTLRPLLSLQLSTITPSEQSRYRLIQKHPLFQTNRE